MQKLELTSLYETEMEHAEENPSSRLTARDSFCALRPVREEPKSMNKIIEYFNAKTKESKYVI